MAQHPTHAVYTVTRNGKRRAHTRFLATLAEGHVIEFGTGADMGTLDGAQLTMPGLAGGAWRVEVVPVTWDGVRYVDAR